MKPLFFLDKSNFFKRLFVALLLPYFYPIVTLFVNLCYPSSSSMQDACYI